MPNKRKSHEQFVNEIAMCNSDIEIIGKYSYSNKKITCRCKIDNYVWDVLPSDLLRGRGCPKCAKVARRTHDEFINEIKKINSNIEILSKYRNVRTKIKCKCKNDGEMWITTASNLLNGTGCPKCAGTMKRSTEDFLYEMKAKNPNIEIISEYQNCEQKVKCKCNICNRVWNAKPKHLLSGVGYPSCSESKGEKKIRKFLIEHNIIFESQKSFEGLIGINGGTLSYDFYLPEYNLLVEYQGIQHEKPTDFGFGKKCANNKYMMQQEHDKRKRYFAKNHSIVLLEIWYYDFENIDTVLNSSLL